MEKITVSDWDTAEFLETEEDVSGYIEAVLQENDARLLLKALGNIARSKGIAKLAAELNLSREGLYDSLFSNGNPSFTTVFKVLDNLGYRFKIERKTA